MTKGSLARFLSDNLGANQCLGLVESFVSYFCRLCSTSKEESEYSLKEQTQLLRTIESYQKCVQTAEDFVADSKPIDLKKTKGVKRQCIFNELQYFHMLDNPTLDVMHDVNEGLIPLFLEHFFIFCDTNRIVRKSGIIRMVRDFNYGLLQKPNKPSLINFDRSNLGQNAKQLYAIMLHLPFIFANFKEKLKKVWPAMETLLKSMQIIYSHKICEDDINNLASYIELHYTVIMEVFAVKLRPKHHHVLHYPNAIRLIGPIIHSWMMRFESKHKFFTKAAHNTNNFVNIAKTLAKKHQEAFSFKTFATDSIETSKFIIDFERSHRYVEFSDQISRFVESENLNKLKVLKFVKLNSIEYRNGLMVIENDIVHEIVQIFSIDKRILFFCCPYYVKQFCSYNNSIEIERQNNSISDYNVIPFLDLKNPRSYERKVPENKFFIICDTLEFKIFM